MDFNNYEPRSFSEEKNYNYVDYGSGGSSDDVVSIGTWILIFIVLAIPFVNIIGILVMAFGNYNETIKNFGKAALIVFGVLFLFSILLGACSSL